MWWNQLLIYLKLSKKLKIQKGYINHNHLDNKKNIMNDVYEIYNYDK